MGLYSQTTELQKYGQMVAGIAPEWLAQKTQAYEINRAKVLGLPLMSMGNDGRPVPIQQANVSLRDKVAYHGTELGGIVQDNSEEKALIEKQVLKAVTQIGGYDAINSNGPWAFILNYLPKADGDFVRTDDGKIKGPFALSSLPFRITVPGTQNGQSGKLFSVDLNFEKGDGSAELVFTPLNQAAKDSVGDPM